MIRIHLSEQGRTTDYQQAARLENIAPLSNRRAQDVLVATKRYLARPRLFRSCRSLIVNLQRSTYSLKEGLIDDHYRTELTNSPIELLFSFLSEFSDVYPNLQQEYS